MESRPSPLAEALSSVASGLKHVIQAEIHLAKVEFKDSVKSVGGSTLRITFFSLVAALGILPFLAFLVIGLGTLLNHNYWLSALLISLVCFAGGGFFAYQAYSSVQVEDLTLPAARRALDQTVQQIGRQVTRSRNAA